MPTPRGLVVSVALATGVLAASAASSVIAAPVPAARTGPTAHAGENGAVTVLDRPVTPGGHLVVDVPGFVPRSVVSAGVAGRAAAVVGTTTGSARTTVDVVVPADLDVGRHRLVVTAPLPSPSRPVTATGNIVVTVPQLAFVDFTVAR